MIDYWEHESPPTAPTPGPPAPWPAPDPTYRLDYPSDFSRLGPSRRSRRRRAARNAISLGLVGALVGGLIAYAAFGGSPARPSRQAAPTTAITAAPAPSPARTTVPATLPPRTAPASPASPANPTSPTAPTAPTTPAPQPAPTPAPTSADQQTASLSSLEVGVVDIYTVLKYQDAEAAGTGIILSANGEILTNNHVVAGATTITVTVVSTGKSFSAKVVGTDAADDVALLQLKGASGLSPAHLGDSATVKVGDAVVAVGNAGGRGGKPTTAPGQVTALDQSISASDENGGNVEDLRGLIQVDARLQAGESGGPLYNAAGEVIGVDTAGSAFRRFRGGGGVGFAIPINAALDIAQQIRSGQEGNGIVLGTPGFLGVGTRDVPTADGTGGAAIDTVVQGSPADKIGLQTNDVIDAIDGDAVNSTDDLGALLHRHHGGDNVTVAWTGTDGQAHSAKATLIEGPAA